MTSESSPVKEGMKFGFKFESLTVRKVSPVKESMKFGIKIGMKVQAYLCLHA